MAELASTPRLIDLMEHDSDDPLSVKITIPMTASLAKAIDDHFHSRRFGSKAAAARDLIEAGLRTMPFRRPV